MDRDALARIGDALAAEPDRQHALELLLTEARRLTRAEAGTVYLRERDRLRFTAVQNDVLARRLGAAEARRRLVAEPLALVEPSVASYVALTRGVVNIPDVYEIPLERPYRFDRHFDAVHAYRTQSMLAMPLRDGRGEVVGVIQLINARDDAGTVVAFDQEGEELLGALLAEFTRARAAW
jgi:GAF domain-containing protein